MSEPYTCPICTASCTFEAMNMCQLPANECPVLIDKVPALGGCFELIEPDGGAPHSEQLAKEIADRFAKGIK